MFALNALGSASVNLIFITSVTAGLLVMGWLRNKLYLKLHNDILEASFILNLCIFSAATYHVKETGQYQAGLAYTSVGIAFATFTGIFLFHIHLLLMDTSTAWKKVVVTAKKGIIHLRGQDNCAQDNNELQNNAPDESQNEVWNQLTPTTSIVELNRIGEF